METIGKYPFKRKYDVCPEINSISYDPVICLFSEDDSDGISDRIYNDELEIWILPHGHRLNCHV